MTTTISSINAGSTSAANETTAQKSKLSNSTKSKLAELGIQETDGMTESEAQAKIAQAQQQQIAQNQSENEDNSSEEEIRSEAKSLASAVGISVSSDDDVSEILNKIGNELEEMLENAEGNPSVLSQLSSYLSQLTSLDSQYDNIQTSQNNMYKAMNMVSTNNKISLGLQ